jgi:hypothetical protein
MCCNPSYQCYTYSVSVSGDAGRIAKHLVKDSGVIIKRLIPRRRSLVICWLVKAGVYRRSHYQPLFHSR